MLVQYVREFVDLCFAVNESLQSEFQMRITYVLCRAVKAEAKQPK